MLEASPNDRRFLHILSLLGVAAVYLAAVASGLIHRILDDPRLSALDSATNAFFQPFRHAPLVEIFLWITTLGSGPTIFIVVLVATGFLTWETRHFVRLLWIVYLGTEATAWATKYAIGRVRPDFTTVATAVSPSFPSGHAASSIAVYGFVAYMILSRVPAGRQRVGVIVFTGMSIALVGFSRIFLSLHFVTDVVAGYLIGGFWLLLGIALFRRFPTISGVSPNPPRQI